MRSDASFILVTLELTETSLTSGLAAMFFESDDVPRSRLGIKGY